MIRGDQLASALGGYDRWLTFRKVVDGKPGGVRRWRERRAGRSRDQRGSGGRRRRPAGAGSPARAGRRPGGVEAGFGD